MKYLKYFMSEAPPSSYLPSYEVSSLITSLLILPTVSTPESLVGVRDTPELSEHQPKFSEFSLLCIVSQSLVMSMG